VRSDRAQEPHRTESGATDFLADPSFKVTHYRPTATEDKIPYATLVRRAQFYFNCAVGRARLWFCNASFPQTT
jgi:hypothetical protein